MLGTGVVGRTLATKLIEVGHDVMMGSREATNDRSAEWVASTGGAGRAGRFAEAAEHGEIVFNATSGQASLAALELAGAENLAGKVLIDVANALDFSHGRPPSLFVANTDSLGEQIQRAFPAARVVKALNTVDTSVMVTPGALPSPTDIFVAGDDTDAKAVVEGVLGSFAWPAEHVVDLGDLTAARGMEGYTLLWVRVMQAMGTAAFNVSIVASGRSERSGQLP